MTASKKCEEILHCKQMNHEQNACTECQLGYYLLEEDHTCRERQNKTCDLYHLNLDQCQSCLESQYLDMENLYKCTPRSKTESNCVQYDLYKDECQTCQENSILADDVGP